MDNVTFPVATPFGAQALIHRLSEETLCEIFLTLALTDIPSLRRPQGWFLQVNGVCRRWRYIALRYAELWATNAGSFPSDDMTDLMIERARDSALCFDGHFEDHAGAGYVLTEYQFSLIEEHHDRIRSFVHDDYYDWSDMFYRLKGFPRLEMARIWDDSGPDMWPPSELIDAPCLHSLYMNNVLIPFNALSLVYLRVDMDNQNWSSSRNAFNQYEPEGCEAIPRVFPTHEFIAFLQRSPLLERLVITDMPLLLSEYLPSVSELRSELPRLRVLHLGGKSLAMGDFLRRLTVPLDTQVFIDTEVMDGTHEVEPVLLNVIHECIRSTLYDSLRMSITPLHDILLQWWSSEASGIHGGLDSATSLGLTLLPSSSEPAFTLRLPSVTREIVELDTFEAIEPPWHWREGPDKLVRFYLNLAKMFHARVEKALWVYHPTLKYLDYTDAPHDGAYFIYGSGGDRAVYDSHTNIGRCSATHIVASWSTLGELPAEITAQYHMKPTVEEVTIVNFPCAAYPSQKRHNEIINKMAWNRIHEVLERRHKAGGVPVSLRLAESTSEMSELARLDEPRYIHTIAGSYEEAVRAVTQKGYDRVAPYLKSFEDLRNHTWP